MVSSVAKEVDLNNVSNISMVPISNLISYILFFSIICTQAIDTEAGIFGQLSYSMTANNNLKMSVADGRVTTKADFSADASNPDALPMVYSLEVRDQADRYEDQLSDTASLYVSIVFM